MTGQWTQIWRFIFARPSSSSSSPSPFSSSPSPPWSRSVCTILFRPLKVEIQRGFLMHHDHDQSVFIFTRLWWRRLWGWVWWRWRYEDEYDYDDEEDYHYEDGVVGNVEEPPLSDAAVVGVKRGIKLFSSLLYFLSTQIPGTRYHCLWSVANASLGWSGVFRTTYANLDSPSFSILFIGEPENQLNHFQHELKLNTWLVYSFANF